jgi:hypothetical protein
MDGLWDDYLSIDVPLAVGAAAVTALLVRFRMRLRGEEHEDAPVLRQFVAYLLAYLSGFAAVRGLDPPARYVVMIAAAALAFGVTLNGPAPLWSQSYARNVGIALCSILVLIVIVWVFAWFGIDATAGRLASSALR